MKMRNVVMAAAAAMVLGLASVASALTYAGIVLDKYAGTGDVTRQGGYYSGLGGEFTVFNSSAGSGNLTLSQAYYSLAAATKTAQIVASPVPSFQSFCVEYHESIGVPTYDNEIVVSESSVAGGPGSASRMTMKDLQPETAYLYSEFAKGTLAGYNYTPGAGRGASALALQQAIWYFQGQAGGATNAFTTAATAAVSSGAWKGIGPVRIINLWTTVTHSGTSVQDVSGLRQDMLYVIPLPASVWSAGMLLGLVVFGRIRKIVKNNA